jgi:ribosomal protein S12 methylthiotransferase
VLDEARELVADGVRELIVVAQDTTYYGMDLHGEPRLSSLLQRLEAVEGLDWIRLMYLYPIHFEKDLVDTIAESQKILPYLDLPLQHINDSVLKRMQRRVNREQTECLIETLRSRIPNLVLRTTFIAGFPGETDEQFAELKQFVEQTRFERMGVFPYSYEPDTPATRLSGHLAEEVKQQRCDELMELQQKAAFEFSESLVGYELDVLIDQRSDDGIWIGRCYADAPEIDGCMYVTGTGFNIGDMIPVEITGARGYDLLGVPSFDGDGE